MSKFENCDDVSPEFQKDRRVHFVWTDLPEGKLLGEHWECVNLIFEDIDGQPDVNSMILFNYLIREVSSTAHIVERTRLTARTSSPDGTEFTFVYPDGGSIVDFKAIHTHCGLDMPEALRSLTILSESDLLKIVQGDDQILKAQIGPMAFEIAEAQVVDYMCC